MTSDTILKTRWRCDEQVLVLEQSFAQRGTHLRRHGQTALDQVRVQVDYLLPHGAGNCKRNVSSSTSKQLNIQQHSSELTIVCRGSLECD